MLSTIISIASEVERTIESYRQERLVHVFESLLFSYLHLGHSLRWDDLYDQAFLEIVKKLRDADLQKASDRLASPDVNLPKTLTFMAKSAEPQIALAALKHPSLPEPALIEAATGGTRRHLLAIASRTAIPASVIGIMLGRQEPTVITQLARNPDAAFSEADYSYLVSLASKDKQLAGLICVRKDLPPELLSFVEMIMQSA